MAEQVKKSNEVKSNLTDKRFKVGKVLKRKPILYLLIAALILLIPVIYGFVNGFISNVAVNKAPQGQLFFYVISENDIKDNTLKEWVSKNRYEKGIHTINHTDTKTSDKYTYILLSTGIKDMDLNIKLFSVDGIKDKIMINGRVEPLNSMESAYNILGNKPYMILRIEEDPREVILGDFNLFDVLNSQSNIKRMNVDMGIFHKKQNSKVTLTLLKGSHDLFEFILSEEMEKQFASNPISDNSLVSIQYEIEKNSDLPKITHIKEIQKTITRVIVEEHLLGENKIQVKSNSRIFTLDYDVSMLEKVRGLRSGMRIIATIEKQGNTLVLTEVLGTDGATN